MNTGKLDKSSGIPLYLQMKQILKDSILRGDFRNGERLPSEPQLSAEYNITRQTIRRALSELVREGFVRKERGKGSFVSMREVKYSIWNFNGFTDYIASIGKKPRTTVLNRNMTELEGFGNCLKLVRARGIDDDGTPTYLTIDTSWIPIDLFPGIDKFDFSINSLYRTMREQYGIQPERVEMTIRPVQAERDELDVFGIERVDPLLNVTGNVFNASNKRIEYVSVLYSPKLEFHMMTSIGH